MSAAKSKKKKKLFPTVSLFKLKKHINRNN